MSHSSTPTQPRCFFITGTGRCGTMLLSRVLSLSPNGVCEHEKCFRYRSMVDCYTNGDETGFRADLQREVVPAVRRHADRGSVFGVSSGHLYPAIPLIHRTFGDGARYILMVRRPDGFVRSALARGFFDPSHPHPCEQIAPHPRDPIHGRWAEASPLEKCLWYWTLVNRMTLDAFGAIPAARWRVVRMEELTPAVVRDLFAFLGLQAPEQAVLEQAMTKKVNASPGSEEGGDVNPYSLPISLGPVATWTPAPRELLDRYTGAMRSRLYGSPVA